MMATNGNKCVQAEGTGEVYIARNKSVNKNIYTASYRQSVINLLVIILYNHLLIKLLCIIMNLAFT